MGDREADNTPSVDFEIVLKSELECIQRRREKLEESHKLPAGSSEQLSKKSESGPECILPAELSIADLAEKGGDPENVEQELHSTNPLADLQQNALEADLCGLAISGGGIRSATFGLGVLQGLAVAGLLPRFDYLSTVSGGGYIGSWFSAWIKRSSFDAVENELHPPRYRWSQTESVDAEQLEHIRRYSNYLAPKPGMLSFDGWALLAIYVRNFLLNQTIFLLAALGLLLSIRGFTDVFTHLHRVEDTFWLTKILFVSAIAAWLAAVVGTSACAPIGGRSRSGENLPGFWAFAVVPWIIGAVLISWLFVTRAATEQWFDLATVEGTSTLLKTVLAYGLLQGLLGVLSMEERVFNGWRGLIAGTIGGVALYFVFLILNLWGSPQEPGGESSIVALVFCFGLPATFLILVLTNFGHVGLAGKSLTELEREWWASLNSRMMMMATVWLGLSTVTLVGPWLVARFFFTGSDWLNTISGIAGTGGIGALLSGLWAARSSTTESGEKNGVMELLARFAPVLFLVLFLLTLATAATWLAYDVYALLQGEAGFDFLSRPTQLLTDLDAKKPIQLVVNFPLFAVLLAAGVLLLLMSQWLGSRVGVNLFSLQNLYANRLTRCYLGASRPKRMRKGSSTSPEEEPRQPDPLVNLDPKDDLPMSSLYPGATGKMLPSEQWGPLHLINAALNRKAGAETESEPEEQAENLTLLERQAESFVFTPQFCGSKSTGYCKSETFAADVSVGTAVAVSGAAVSPNMGYHSSPAITALLTLFNVRLGAWFGNPKRADQRCNPNPSASWKLLMSELAGITASDRAAIYVSDGGHFENVGVYELIRRRCRFIVASEAGADPLIHENIGRIVRQARIDFGVRIELDSNPITPNKDGICEQHFVIGRIHYGDIHKPRKEQDSHASEFEYENNQGIIIWLKASTTGDEPGDLRNHKAMNKDFPYDSTADQFFNETQFESYRELGLHSVQELLSVSLQRPNQAEHGADAINLAAAYDTPKTSDLQKTATSIKKDLYQFPTREVFEQLFIEHNQQGGT